MGQMNESNSFEKTFFRRTAFRRHQLLFNPTFLCNLWQLYESKKNIIFRHQNSKENHKFIFFRIILRSFMHQKF